MPPCLTLRAGPAALRLIREHGLRAEDVDIIPGASGGAKWLALGGLDRFLFGEFLQPARQRPLHLIGSSIGPNDDTFRHFTDLPTTHAALTSSNLRDVLVASGSIPLLLNGVRIAGTSGGVHSDGGVIDYHLDLDFGSGNGLILYPHFYSYVVPGWFDKALPRRRATPTNFQRVLLVAPSAEFVRSLPGGKLPDRDDFYRIPHSERMARWQGVLNASAQLGEELRGLIFSGKIADRVRPW